MGGIALGSLAEEKRWKDVVGELDSDGVPGGMEVSAIPDLSVNELGSALAFLQFDLDEGSAVQIAWIEDAHSPRRQATANDQAVGDSTAGLNDFEGNIPANEWEASVFSAIAGNLWL